MHIMHIMHVIVWALIKRLIFKYIRSHTLFIDYLFIYSFVMIADVFAQFYTFFVFWIQNDGFCCCYCF